jgi:hypothetical protein
MMGDNYYIRHGLKFLWYLLTKLMKSMIHVSQIQAFFFIMKRKNQGGIDATDPAGIKRWGLL